MFAGRVKTVSHLSCRTSAILKYFVPWTCKPFFMAVEYMTSTLHARHSDLIKKFAKPFALSRKIRNKRHGFRICMQHNFDIIVNFSEKMIFPKFFC